MVWFRVDDNLPLHPKVVEAGNAAMGLWVRAGAWSAANLTDGFVPTRVALRLGSRSLCQKLVDAGLFEKTKNGWNFHDWCEKNFTKNQVEANREQTRQRVANHRKRRLTAVPEQSTVTPLETAPLPYPYKGRDLSSKRPVGADPPSGAALNGGGAETNSRCPFGCADRDGYRPNGTVCDHIDRTATIKTGIATVRATMGWKTEPQQAEALF